VQSQLIDLHEIATLETSVEQSWHGCHELRPSGTAIQTTRPGCSSGVKLQTRLTACDQMVDICGLGVQARACWPECYSRSPYRVPRQTPLPGRGACSLMTSHKA
jgi:hypothetical protein